MRRKTSAGMLLLVMGCGLALAETTKRDTNGIQWMRDADKASACAKKEGKLLLRLSGRADIEAMRHPFVVDVAQLFVPQLVTSEEGVLQVLSASDQALTETLPVGKDAAPVLKLMRDALRSANMDVPKYLDMVVFENYANSRERATVFVACYDPGEARLGGLEGVVMSRGGVFLPSRAELAQLSEETRKTLRYNEVVELFYDPTVLTYETILQKATGLGCFGASVARTDEQLKIAQQVLGAGRCMRSGMMPHKVTDKRPLSWYKEHHFNSLPLTEIQRSKLNSGVYSEETREDTAYLDSLIFPCQIALRDEMTALREQKARVPSSSGIGKKRDLESVGIHITRMQRDLHEMRKEGKP